MRVSDQCGEYSADGRKRWSASDVNEYDQVSEPLRVKVMNVGEILLMEERGDFLLQVAHKNNIAPLQDSFNLSFFVTIT